MFVTTALALAIVAVPRWDRFGSRRGKPPVDEQQFYAAVYAELRAGASLRQALVGAAADHDSLELRTVRRVATSGAPFGEIATALRALPRSGARAAVAVRVAAQSGGRAADVFLRLAERAAEDAELERQRRVLTAQSRLSALVVGGLPLVWLIFGGVARLRTLIAHGGLVVVVVGLGMEAIGIALVWRLASS